jgi:predicted HTH domain antitoxin
MRKLLLDVPDELIDLLGDENQARNLMIQAAVAELVRRHVISAGKAAELLGVSPCDLLEILDKFEVCIVDFNPDEDLKPFR